jgi:hypothetical protein
LNNQIKIFPKSKRSQITVFIILAVLIIAVVGIFFLTRERTQELSREQIEPEVQPIYSFVENCILDEAEEVILTVAEFGGAPYRNPAMDNGIAYYLYNNQNYMPSKNNIADLISSQTEAGVILCTGEFEDFPDYEISSEEISVSTGIEGGQIVLNAAYPLIITKDDKKYLFRNFNDIIIPVRLGLIYDEVSNLMEEQMTHTDSICIGCVNDLAEENGLYVQTIDYDEDTIIFTIHDDVSKINGRVFVFNFANKYEPFIIE